MNAQPTPDDRRLAALLPAMSNLHSHTFQRAMAGMTEARGDTSDSFWTWRDVMYRFVQHLTPDDVEAIAAFAFMEMQEAGFAAVAEFHYLHHAAGGAAYANRAELSARIISAAQQTGIGLTLLPVLYSYAGLGQKPLAENQLRFGNDIESYVKLHQSAAASLRKELLDDACMGVAPHSLRAVSAEDLDALSVQFPRSPFHIHIAEQTAEVDAVLAATGRRPVEWLLDHADVNTRWCLIHATHLTTTEVSALARSGAVAGLCPVTESNLGDGIFCAPEFTEAGGRFGVGSDSNINISVAAELCTLEYGQRLRDRKRNVLARQNMSTGHYLYTSAAQSGAQALGRACGSIATGMWADLVAIDADSVQLAGLKPEQWIDGWVFASSHSPVRDVWSAGRHCVSDGQHVHHAVIEQKYRAVIKRLADLI